MSTVVYTAIFGRYDRLHAPAVVSKDVDYIAYTDQQLVGGIDNPWREHIAARISPYANPCKQARRHKILFHKVLPKEYEYVIWIDGNVQLRCGVGELLDWLGDNDIAAIQHPQRDCIYQEAKCVMSWKLDAEHIVQSQMQRYEQDGYPVHNGLAATFVLVRRNTPRVVELCEAWWKEVELGSVRDQLSFDYVCWKLGVACSLVTGGIYRSKWYSRNALHG